MTKKYTALLGAMLAAVSIGVSEPASVDAAVVGAARPTPAVTYHKDSPSWQAFCQKYKLNPEVKGKRVIMDFDLTYLNDDWFALMEVLKLHQYGFIKLEGISIVGANNIVAGCTYDTLATLEELGYRDIPVYMGIDKPLKGFKDAKKITDHVGIMGYMGAYMSLDNYTRDWKSDKAKKIATSDDFLQPSTLETEAKDSSTFMVETVKKYPGEVMIVSLGGLMNVANAIKKTTSVKDTVSTAASQEAVSIGGSGTIAKTMETETVAEPVVKPVTSLVVEIQFE